MGISSTLSMVKASVRACTVLDTVQPKHTSQRDAPEMPELL